VQGNNVKVELADLGKELEAFFDKVVEEIKAPALKNAISFYAAFASSVHNVPQHLVRFVSNPLFFCVPQNLLLPALASDHHTLSSLDAHCNAWQ
jgi:hypothetical protein